MVPDTEKDDVEDAITEVRKVATKAASTAEGDAFFALAEALQASLDLRTRLTAQLEELSLPTMPTHDKKPAAAILMPKQATTAETPSAIALLSSPDSHRRRPPHGIGSDGFSPLFRPPLRAD